MSDSPASILYDANGNPLSVVEGTAIPTNTPGIMALGRDGSGNARPPGIHVMGDTVPTSVATTFVEPIGMLPKTTTYTYTGNGDIDKIEVVLGDKKRTDQFNYDQNKNLINIITTITTV